MFLFRVSTVACFLLDPILYLEVGILSKDLWDEESSCYLEGDGGNKLQLMTLQLKRLHLMITLLFMCTNRESSQT